MSLYETGKGYVPAVPDAYDLVVIGGTLFGCFAACRAARQGKRVVLVERRTFLGTDITATLRPWLHRKGWENFNPEMKELFLPAAEKPEVGVPFDPDEFANPFGEEIPLFCGSVKKQLMATLLRDGVHVLLMTGAWAVVADAKKTQASAVVVASKFGLQLIRCKSLLDTNGQLSARNRGGHAGRCFSIEFFDVQNLFDRRIAVPAALGLNGNEILLHKGKRAQGQFFVEFQFNPELDDAENEARSKAEALCAHLRRHHLAFVDAWVNRMAWETHKSDCDENTGKELIYENALSLCVAKKSTLSCQDLVDMELEAAACVDSLSSGSGHEADTDVIYHRSGEIPLQQCTLTPLQNFNSQYWLMQVVFAYERHLPKGHHVDVLVAGGGTAGAMAGMAAVEQRANVAVVEYFPELGGTKTLGGVCGFFAGHRKTKLHDIYVDGVNKERDAFGGREPTACITSYLRKQLTAQGGRFLANSILCGVTMDGSRATGVVFEREGALSILTGDVIVDATGDGDVAAFAGASYEFGNERMNATQNFSQWDFDPRGEGPSKPSSNTRDHDIIMNHCLSEFQRGYQLTHLRAHYYDFRPMLTVRESRRIVGECRINLRDILTERRYPDTICLAASTFDPHTFGDTPLTRVGCVLIFGISAIGAIPYRAILPKGIEGLLISAKAISQTHNALQFTRMSFDVMTLGYVTGRIAASISREGISTRQFDVKSLEQDLFDLHIIGAGDQFDSAQEWEKSSYIEKLVDNLAEGKSHGLLNVLMVPMEVIEPVLSGKYASLHLHAQRCRVAKALAWCGNPVGNDLLINEMKTLRQEEIEAAFLPREHPKEDAKGPYWPINQNIALLGMSGDQSALSAILEIADSLVLNNPPVMTGSLYKQGRIDWCLIPWYNRIINICFAVEQMPDPRAVRSLTRFLDDPYIGGNVSTAPEHVATRVYPAILETRIAATLARCGDKRGFDVLIEYLNDVHYLLADYAQKQLALMLPGSREQGYSQCKEYINSLTFPLPMTPRHLDDIEL
jgi:hypothetical protein